MTLKGWITSQEMSFDEIEPTLGTEFKTDFAANGAHFSTRSARGMKGTKIWDKNPEKFSKVWHVFLGAFLLLHLIRAFNSFASRHVENVRKALDLFQILCYTTRPREGAKALQ